MLREHLHRLRRPAAIFSLLGWILTAVFIFAAWPVRFGGATGYTIVVGHSMDPTYDTGDLVITRPQESYSKGEIIVYRVPKGEPAEGLFVVHRIIGGDTTGYVTQGDNTEHPDIWKPTPEDIQGVVQLRVPKAGFVMVNLTSPLAIAAVGGIFMGWMLWPRDENDLNKDNAQGSEGSPGSGDEGPSPQ